jgi:hypothetical protein
MISPAPSPQPFTGLGYSHSTNVPCLTTTLDSALVPAKSLSIWSCVPVKMTTTCLLSDCSLFSTYTRFGSMGQWKCALGQWVNGNDDGLGTVYRRDCLNGGFSRFLSTAGLKCLGRRHALDGIATNTDPKTLLTMQNDQTSTRDSS